MKNKAYNKIISLTAVSLLFLVSCRFQVPVKEMAIAKLTISRAIEVKSEKYAPEELKTAESALLKSHDYVKDDDADNAKKEAEKALKSANAAINKSLPLLAKDTIDQAKALYGEADLAFAEKYASEDFALATQRINDAENSYGNNEYWESYLAASEGLTYAGEAKNKALANIAALKESVRRIKDDTTKLIELGAEKYAPEEIKTINENLTQAQEYIDAGNLKDAFTNVQLAEEAYQEAYLMTYRSLASEHIKAADEAMGAKGKELNAKDKDEITAMIASARDLFDNKMYADSYAKALEALNAINGVNIYKEKKLEEKKFEEKKAVAIEQEAKGIKENIYIVKLNPKNRDCLWKIALTVYKDARLWPLIYMANRDKIKDPDLIFPGQSFLIPALPEEVKKEVQDKEGQKESVKENAEPEAEKAVVPSEVQPEAKTPDNAVQPEENKAAEQPAEEPEKIESVPEDNPYDDSDISDDSGLPKTVEIPEEE